jgi:hypothetical protein
LCFQIIENEEKEEVLQEREAAGEVENSRDSDETKPCTIMLDSNKVNTYIYNLIIKKKKIK